MKKLFISAFLSLVFFSSSVFADITTGLVAHYEFENNNINDTSGSGFNLTTVGNPFYVPGKIGQAYSFNGSDNNLSAYGTGLSSDTGTISYWINTNATGIRSIVGLGTSSSVDINTSINGSDFVASSPSGTFTNTIILNDNAWHHVVLTFAGVNSTSLYVDGNLINPDFSSGADFNLSDNIYIGHYEGANQYTDLIDDVRIYNRDLGPGDVLQLYKNVPTVMTYVHGGAIELSNGVIDIGEPLGSTDFTVEGWVNTTNISYLSLLSFDDFENSGEAGYIDIDSSGKLNISSGVEGSTSIISTAIINDGNWHHIAIAYNDLDENLSIYIDGALDSVGTGIVTTTGVTRFGDTLVNGSILIDNFRLWDVERTAAEIQESMNYQLNGTEVDPVAYYNFDERVGSTVKDITGNGNDGTLDVNATRINFLGNALRFSGVDNSDSVTVAENNILDLNNTFTINTWFKTDENSSTGIQQIINKYDPADLRSYAIDLIDVNGSQKIQVALSPDGTDSLTGNGIVLNSTSDIKIGQWYHLSVTSDGANVNIYINGNLDNTVAYSLGLFQNNTDVVIGANISGTEVFNGTIAEISVWDKALTQDEIYATMHTYLSGQELGLLAYWPLNEGTLSIASDRRGLSNGTISGTTWENNAPLIIGDKIYTSDNINIIQSLLVDKGTTVPTYSYNGNIPSTVSYFDGTFGIFQYNGKGNETLDFNASENGANLNTIFNVVSYANPINITINLSNLVLAQTNITSINVVGQDGNTENLTVDPGYIYVDGTNTISSPIYNPDQSISINVEIDNNGNTEIWWYNFYDGKLYQVNDGSLAFKTTIGYTSNTLNIDAATTNFIYDPLNVGPIYNRYRDPGFGTITINFDVNGTDGHSIEVNASIISGNSVSISNLASTQVLANNQNTIILAQIDAITIGETYLNISILDLNTTATRYKYFAVNISKEFDIISTKETDGFTPTSVADYNGTLYIFSSDLDFIDAQRVEIEKFEVINSVYDTFSELEDINGTVVVLNDQTDTMPNTFEYLNTPEDNASLTVLYNTNVTPFTFNDPNSQGQRVYVTYPTAYLDLDYNNIITINFSSLSDFMKVVVPNVTTHGIRDNSRSRFLVFDPSDDLSSVANSGNLIELDENGTTLTAIAGTWNKVIVDTKEIVTINPSGTVGIYKMDRAFYWENNTIYGFEYKAANNVYSYILLNQAAKNELYYSFSPNPKMAIPLVTGEYKYVSLTSQKSLCSSSMQNYDGNYTAICDQTNTLETVFGVNTILKYQEAWEYWNSIEGVNAAYGMNKFSVMSPLDGLLIYPTSNNPVYIPYDDDAEQFNDYNGTRSGKWYLLSNNKDQTISEISTSLGSDKIITYMLVFRDNKWYIYSPMYQYSFDPAAELTDVKKGESYWILYEDIFLVNTGGA